MARSFLEKRASTVLFRFLKSNSRTGVYLLPANVCPIVPTVFHKAHVPFEFLDIHPSTLTLDPKLVLQRLRQGGCAGVLFVRTYGAMFDMEAYFSGFKNACSSLLIIDDRCLALPRFEHSGGCADLELYSTGYSKFVDLGWGGWGNLGEGVDYEREAMPFLQEAHDNLIEEFRRIAQEPECFRYKDSSWLDAAELDISWQDFKARVSNRAQAAAAHQAALNDYYRRFLPYECCLPMAFRNWRFHVWVSDPRALLNAIFDAGLFASSHYASLIPAFGLGHAPHAALLGSKVVNLFNDFRFNLEKAEATARCVADYLRKSGEEPYPWSNVDTATN